MKRLIEILVHQKRAVFLVLFIILFLGIKSYVTIAKEDSPSIQIPIVIIHFFLDGISTEDAERLLIKPSEKYLKTIKNIKKIVSTATFNGGHIVIEFQTNTDIKRAVDDVKDQISKAKKDLPPSIEEPIIQEINISEEPVLGIAITSDLPGMKLLQIARQLKDKIKELPSVLDAEIIGSSYEELEIILDPDEMNRYRINPQEVQRMFEENNHLITAGKLKTASGQHIVQVESVIKKPEDILDIPVKVLGKQIITLKDVAKIRFRLAETESGSRVSGKNVISINIKKKSGENTIDTIDKVKKLVIDEKKSWPESIGYSFLLDASKEIIESVGNLENNIILAVILTLIPLFFTLGFRPAILVAISIPLSFLMGVMVVDGFNYTMNVIVIFSLILSIGMLVDASIVVCEYADVQLKSGKSALEAYSLAASKMWWPIFGSTITTLIVYMPLFFWPGFIGKFMFFMPLTITATVASSLIIAFSFVPVIGEFLSSRGWGGSQKKSVYLPFEQKIIDLYEDYLKKILSYPRRFALTICALLIVVIIGFGFLGAGFEFFPKVEPKFLNVSVKSRDNLALAQIDKIMQNIEQLILNNFSADIETVYSNFGSVGKHNDEIGLIALEMKHWKKRKSAEKIEDNLRQFLSDIHGVVVEVSQQKDGPPNMKPLMLEISASDSKQLEAAYKLIMPLVKNNQSFGDVESNYDEKSFEWDIIIDKEEIEKYGMTSSVAGSYIQMITKGLKLSSYRPDNLDREVDIIIRFPEAYRNLKYLESMMVPSRYGLVSLASFSHLKPVEKIKSITRIDGKKSIKISANIKESVVLDNEIMGLKKKFSALALTDDIVINFAGESADQEETGKFLTNAFLLALVLMYLVMLIQFNSFFQTAIVMSAVFLSTTGVLLGLMITNQPFGVVMCGLGIISLAGVVVNNNIIFLDTYNDIRSRGTNQYDAIVETGKTRIRPILLTALTAVLGLLPMIIGVSINFVDLGIDIDPPSNKWWKQLATTIAGGLSFATILTLFFTPALLMIRKERSHSSPNTISSIF